MLSQAIQFLSESGVLLTMIGSSQVRPSGERLTAIWSVLAMVSEDMSQMLWAASKATTGSLAALNMPCL